MNFLQIHDETFINTESIDVIYREGKVLFVRIGKAPSARREETSYEPGQWIN